MESKNRDKRSEEELKKRAERLKKATGIIKGSFKWKNTDDFMNFMRG